MKKFILLLITTLLVSVTAFAGFEGKQDGSSLKIFNKIDCGAGLTCTRGGNGDFDIAADAVGGAVSESDLAAQAEGLNIDRIAIFDYDFSVDGGAIGNVATGVSLPASALVDQCWFYVDTQLVDGGAGTLAVTCEDAGNLLAAADQSGVAAGAFFDGAPDGTAANMVSGIAASCDITWVIAGAAITAGKLRGFCSYSVAP